MTSIAKLQAMGEQYKHLPCGIKGCTRNRKNVSPYCTVHADHKARYGHPLGQAVMQWEYREELKVIQQFFKDHTGHPAITAAETFIADWLKQVSTKEAIAGNSVFARLHHHCVPPRRILEEMCAVWLYSDRHPHALVDDERLTFALARCAARLAGWHRKTYASGSASVRPKGEDVRAAGERIRATLSRFFLNLNQTLKAMADDRDALRDDLSRPFLPTPTKKDE